MKQYYIYDRITANFIRFKVDRNYVSTTFNTYGEGIDLLLEAVMTIPEIRSGIVESLTTKKCTIPTVQEDAMSIYLGNCEIASDFDCDEIAGTPEELAGVFDCDEIAGTPEELAGVIAFMETRYSSDTHMDFSLDDILKKYSKSNLKKRYERTSARFFSRVHGNI